MGFLNKPGGKHTYKLNFYLKICELNLKWLLSQESVQFNWTNWLFLCFVVAIDNILIKSTLFFLAAEMNLYKNPIYQQTRG